MSVYKLFYKFIKSPMNDLSIHEVSAEAGSFALKHQLELIEDGDYEIEFWSIDDVGNVSEKKICNVTASGYQAPSPVVGGVFSPTVIAETLPYFRMTKANVSMIFSRAADSFGYAFNWSDLSFDNVIMQQNSVDVVLGGWLYKKLMTTKTRIPVEMVVSAGKELYVTFNGITHQAIEKQEDGTFKIHTALKNIVGSYNYKNGRIFFDILRPAKFEWR